jgi:hypothetical protein
MITRLLILTLTSSLTLVLFSCEQTDHKAADQPLNINSMPRAEQIKISELRTVMTRLQNRQLEFDFFGIHSNGIDCIYFIPDSNLFSIEFEAMYEEQLPWIDKLKQFAKQNGYDIKMTTYNNTPHYKTSEPAQVLRIETKSNLEQTATIGQNIMTQVFRNGEQTTYEVVP